MRPILPNIDFIRLNSGDKAYYVHMARAQCFNALIAYKGHSIQL